MTASDPRFRDHVEHVCRYHARHYELSDPEWASRWLSRQVRDGILTADEANQIRREVGWDVVGEQMELILPGDV